MLQRSKLIHLFTKIYEAQERSFLIEDIERIDLWTQLVSPMQSSNVRLKIFSRQLFARVVRGNVQVSSRFFLLFSRRLSAPRYSFQFARSTLPLSHANICRYTLKRSTRRQSALAKFGISLNLSSTNIRLLIFRERLYAPLCSLSSCLFRVLSTTFTTSSRWILASLISTSHRYYVLPSSILSNDFSHEKEFKPFLWELNI